jgi:hypothetical protein
VVHALHHLASANDHIEGIIMKISKSTLLATVLLSGVSAFASAGNLDALNELTARPAAVQGTQSAPVTRADVKAQFLAAQTKGELIAGENGETARELDPRLYPAPPALAGTPKTRGEVRGEFIAAQKAGELIIGENGETARELNAHAYPAVSSPDHAPAQPGVVSQRHARASDKGYFGI